MSASSGVGVPIARISTRLAAAKLTQAAGGHSAFAEHLQASGAEQVDAALLREALAGFDDAWLGEGERAWVETLCAKLGSAEAALAAAAQSASGPGPEAACSGSATTQDVASQAPAPSTDALSRTPPEPDVLKEARRQVRDAVKRAFLEPVVHVGIPCTPTGADVTKRVRAAVKQHLPSLAETEALALLAPSIRQGLDDVFASRRTPSTEQCVALEALLASRP